MGKVVKGSISHNDTLGCLSPAVDSSQPTYTLSKQLRSQHVAMRSAIVESFSNG